ncbi:hypothetical protein DFH01_07415 [Falsiroseomonas bella]|uniref:Uncharacterized protein n=1 Tax=Falsiroseomonas bella TaxID=2184016 RepID=A0A317FJ28_9PROT|nr:hypothetical protein [Falsiroseomonas bella]PWS39061.1 hypothetical protein DFH01_07415 [Falsiroseomonas bella]
MSATLHAPVTPGALVAELDRRQPLLARLGWAFLALLLLCLAAMAFDPRAFDGASVWVKPAKFAASFVLWFWTLAWAWGVLAPEAARGRIARLVLWGTVAAALFEQGWITWRAALGGPSHFAKDALGAVMYSLMGVGAVTLVALAALLGLLVLLNPRPGAPRPWVLAVGLGLVVGGVLGGFTGAAISVLDSPHVGGAATNAAGLPPFYWSRDGGDLRFAHFLGIHAMQALPLLALLGAGARLVGLAAAGWTALTLAAFTMAQRGIPLSP